MKQEKVTLSKTWLKNLAIHHFVESLHLSYHFFESQFDLFIKRNYTFEEVPLPMAFEKITLLKVVRLLNVRIPKVR